MTANELAIDLDLQSSQMEYGYAVSDWKLLSDAATMLRQQVQEIEALKKELALQKLSNIGQEIERELTDEEIKQIFRNESGFEVDTCPIAILDFARAILKKASEK